jgi:hypothetical protein
VVDRQRQSCFPPHYLPPLTRAQRTDLFIFLTCPLALNKATLEVRAPVALTAPNDGEATDEVTLKVVLVHVVVLVVVLVLVLVFDFRPCRGVMSCRANQ